MAMEDFNVEPVTADDEVGRIIHAEFANELCDKFVLIGEDRTCMSEKFAHHADSIRNFKVDENDIWIMSYPKAGTTWTQEMVWLIANDLDFEGAKIQLPHRITFLEISTLTNTKTLKGLNPTTLKRLEDSIGIAANAKHPRFIKTHLPLSLLPSEITSGTKKPKIIYVMRNPKDVCVSYYHHGKILQGCRSPLENFHKVFLAGKVLYGSYWKHIFGYWNRRDSLNMLFIKYEDMKENLPGVIAKVADFLGKKLGKEDVESLCRHLSFESMKKNPAVNAEALINLLKANNFAHEDGSFMRSGTVGQYKEELSREMIEEFNNWIEGNVKGTSLEEDCYFKL